MVNSSKYIIEDNEFIRFGNVSDPLIGLLINNSGGDVPFPIQNNLFSNLSAGTYITGNNSIFDGCPFGLQYYCNKHVSTGYDLFIDGTIQKTQRFNSGMITSTGNKFSTSSYPNLSLNGICNIDYYYNNSSLFETPTLSGAINLIAVSDINTCTSNYPIGTVTTPSFITISSKNELNGLISKLTDGNKSLNNLTKGYTSTVNKRINKFDNTKNYSDLNLSTKSKFLSILNFINQDTTLAIIKKNNYISKLYLSDNTNESKFNLFLAKSFSGRYSEAEKLLKSLNFIKLIEFKELLELLNIIINSKLDSNLVFDKSSLEKVSNIHKKTTGSYSKQFSELILDKYSSNRYIDTLMSNRITKLIKEQNKEWLILNFYGNILHLLVGQWSYRDTDIIKAIHDNTLNINFANFQFRF